MYLEYIQLGLGWWCSGQTASHKFQETEFRFPEPIEKLETIA